MTTAARSRLWAGRVIIVALLAMCAQPASAATAGLAVASQHTDFGTGDEAAPGTLEGFEVSGSGDSATLDSATSSGYNVVDDDGDGTAEQAHAFAGDAGDPITTEWQLEPSQDTSVSEITVGVDSVAGDDYGPVVDVYIVQESPDSTGGEGTLVKDGWEPAWSSGDQTIDLDTSVQMQGGETWTVEFVTQNSDGDTENDFLRLNTDDDSGLTDWAWTSTAGSTQDWGGDITLPERGSGRYLSANHSVTDAEAMAVGLDTVASASVTVRAEYWDGSTWTVANETTVTSSQNVSLGLPDVGSETWRTNVTYESTGSSTSVVIADDSVLFDATVPTGQLDSPPDGAELTESSVDFTVDVSDPDFGTAQGDSVEAVLYVDGSVAGSQTVTSNSTVTVTEEISSGGDHAYYWEFKDSYGEKTTTATRNVTVPSDLTFRSEQDPDQILDTVQVNVTAYYGGETVQRNTTNGVLDLSGFPVDEPIIIRATGENYTTRVVVIESIYEQSNVYLLNDSVPTYSVRFDLQDPTGEYPRSDTVLFVERALTQNNSTEWRVITGDEFGVQGVPATVEQNQRYRLRLKNLNTGTTATIGAYTAVQSETVTISPGSATIEIPNSTKAYGWSVTENESQQHILFEYLDTENNTDSVTITIYERFNKSNVLVDNETFTGSSNIVYQVPLTANQTNKTWMAEIYVERGGETYHFREAVTGPTVSIIPQGLDSVWRTSVGVFVLLITGMVFSGLNQSTGAIATAMVGGMLWQIGLLSGVATGPAIVLAIAISIVNHYRGGGA